MNDIYVIRKKIESLGFTRSIGTSLYKRRRNLEYWVNLEEDESITFESFQRYGRVVNYEIKFQNIDQFTKFAEELLKFAKKEVLA